MHILVHVIRIGCNIAVVQSIKLFYWNGIFQTIEQRMDRVMSPSNWEDDFAAKRRDSAGNTTTASSFSTSIANSRRDDNGHLRHDSSSTSAFPQLGGPSSSANASSNLFPTSSSDGISK